MNKLMFLYYLLLGWECCAAMSATPFIVLDLTFVIASILSFLRNVRKYAMLA